MRIVVGASDHCGWAELVTVGLDGARPVVRDRRRVELVDEGVASAPYHHEGLALPLAEAERVLERTRASVTARCRAALEALRAQHRFDAAVVPASPHALPGSLAAVLASRALTFAADGILYREALAAEAARLGAAIERTPRKSDPIDAAARALGVPRARVDELLAAFGRAAGRPWTKEHREAAARALCVLASHTRVSL